MDLFAAISWRVIPSFDIGGLSVSPHGLGIAAGYGLGSVLTAHRARKHHNIDPQHVWNALTWAVLGVIVGARLFYVAGHIGDYLPDDPLGIFRIWEGGIVFYGGVFGGIAAAYPYIRKHRLPFKQMMDAAAPAFPLGLILGRIGDLIIGDHLGGPTGLPWGFRYQGGELPGCPALPDSGISCPAIGEVVHQTALYDLVNAAILLPVVLLLTRRRRFDGFLIAFTATWYAFARFTSDFARSGPLYTGLRGTQWVSVVLAAWGLWYLVRGARSGTTSPPLPPTDPNAAVRQPAPSPAAPPPDEHGSDHEPADGARTGSDD